MTKPANFPERKRQRQIGALARLPHKTAGKRHSPSKSNDEELLSLMRATETSRCDMKTKKSRG